MEDNDIVALLWERQEPALAHLQDKYSTYLMQITRRIIIDEEDANECVNDVWLKVWNSIPPGKPKHLAGYLAKNRPQSCIGQIPSAQCRETRRGTLGG